MSPDALPDFNNTLRQGVLGVVDQLTAELPGGGVLSFIIGLLWPESDTSEQTWNSIKQYAEKMVTKAIDRERTEALAKRMAGFQKLASTYRDTSMASKQKGQYLTTLLSAFDLFEPDFWDQRCPEQMLPLFTSFGTLWIFALAEQAFFYEAVYHEPDADAAKHLARLHEEIKKYTDGAQATYDRLLAWRFGLLEVKEWQWVYTTQSESEWTFTDNYDGYTISSGRGGDWGYSYHFPAGQLQIEQIAANRVAQINGDFVENLQALLAVAQLWQYADPSVPRPLSQSVVTSQGPIGGLGGAEFQDQPPKDTSRISRIRIRHGGQVVECLELFYDGVSGGAHGNPKGERLEELELAEDERVVKVAGCSGSFIDAIEFTTDKQRSVKGGGTGGSPFSSAGIGSWVDARLFSVSGRSDPLRLTSLSMQWRHKSALPAYIPTYKRNGKAIPAASTIRLQAKDGNYISALVEEYSPKAAAKEYFPKVGKSAVGLQLRPGNPAAAATLADRQAVGLFTTETKAGEYTALGKYSSATTYYYTPSPGERRQLWVIIKVIPSDGPVLFGEGFYLRNLEECSYLYPTDGEYVGTRWEPYAWEALPPG